MNIQLVMGVVVLLLVLFLLMSRRKGSSGGGSFSLDFLPFGKKSAKGAPEARALAEAQTAAAMDHVEMAPMAPPPAPPATAFAPSHEPAAPAVPEQGVPAAPQPAALPAPTAAAPQASPQDWATIQEPGWPSLGEMEGAWSAGSGAAAAQVTDPSAGPGIPAAQVGAAHEPVAPQAPPALEVPAPVDPVAPPAQAPVADAMADWSPAQAMAPQAQERPYALPPAAQEAAQAPEAPASWPIADPAEAASQVPSSSGPAAQPTIEMSPPPAWDPPETVDTPEVPQIPPVEIPVAGDALEEVSWVDAASAAAEAEAAPALDIAPPAVGGATLWDELGPTPEAPAQADDAEDQVAWWDEIDDEPEAEPADRTAALLFGRFALAGVASGAGQQAVCGVTFPEPAEEAPDPSRIHLAVAGAENCRHQDVEVMDKPGFEPSKEGFTVIAGSSDEGPFMASGTYHVD